MIDLNDDNDPMLFKVSVPNGQLLVQYMEVVHTLQASGSADPNPSADKIVAAIRRAARTPEVARDASDATLIAVWYRMTMMVGKTGNA